MNKEDFEKLERENRWSFSKLKAFIECPRKHHYSYVEEIKTDDNVYLALGGFFHELMEAHYTAGNTEEILKEYEKKAHEYDKPPGLLRHVYEEYKIFQPPENVLAVEVEVIEEWDDKDYIIGKADLIYERDGLNILRDFKTTLGKLKYDISSTRYNQQLLLYKAMIEENMGMKLHGIEIFEVRLGILEEVPINKNGKPTADVRRLGLVTYDKYYDYLEEIGLEDAPEYKNALMELNKRGHPLFKRTTVDILDEKIVEENLEDLYGIYKLAKTKVKARKRSILCDYCDYRELCDADYSTLDETGRQFIIDKISKNA